MMKQNFFPGSCVSPDGRFLVGIHKPSFKIPLLRQNDFIDTLGLNSDGSPVTNQINFPHTPVDEPSADTVYEIPNPFPFRGTTYINAKWADRSAKEPGSIKLPTPPAVSMRSVLEKWKNRCQTAPADPPAPSETSPSSHGFDGLDLSKASHPTNATDPLNVSNEYDAFVSLLPRPLLLALAECSTDPQELVRLAGKCCSFQYEEPELEGEREPCGLAFKRSSTGLPVPDISDHDLFEIIANNPHLPDGYKRVMVLKPGIQGSSEITGEWQSPFSAHHGDGLDGVPQSHIFEYLRRNSYIPWGHFAANTADDTVRYKVNDLTLEDMTGMRHLYYQRTYLRLLDELNLLKEDDRFVAALEALPSVTSFMAFHDIRFTPSPLQNDADGHCIVNKRHTDSDHETHPIGFHPTQLDSLRALIVRYLKEIAKKSSPRETILRFNGALWGWNFGFGYAQSGYRLHASHQQIHQQYAMVPAEVDLAVFSHHTSETREANIDGESKRLWSDEVQATSKHENRICFHSKVEDRDGDGKAALSITKQMPSYACGDLVARFVREYRTLTGKNFFECYEQAIRNNERTDGKKDLPASLIVHEDAHVLLFVPKAQTSQWELQLMPNRCCGNILEADGDMRAALDRGILIALQILEKMGARMVTSIEFSKRFGAIEEDQRLIYSFLPKIPHSPGAFSEAQLRWINGHYPEDFADACRKQMSHLNINLFDMVR